MYPLNSTKTCKTSKNDRPVHPYKLLKSVKKCIDCDPAGVVQHRLLAGSCRPLRVLFISGRDVIL